MTDVSQHIINAESLLKTMCDLIAPAGNINAEALYTQTIELQKEVIGILQYSDMLKNKVAL